VLWVEAYLDGFNPSFKEGKGNLRSGPGLQDLYSETLPRNKDPEDAGKSSITQGLKVEFYLGGFADPPTFGG